MVDDGSSDQTWNKLQDLAKTDARIKLYQGGVFRTWLTLAVIVVAFLINGTSLTKLGLGGFDFDTIAVRRAPRVVSPA